MSWLSCYLTEASLLSKYRTRNRGGISEKSREILTDLLKDEIELYEFARQRFYKLLSGLQEYRMIGEDDLAKSAISTQW